MADPTQEAEDPVMVEKLEQLADLVKAVIDDDFDVFEGEDSTGRRFHGVLVDGKCIAILPTPQAPYRGAGETLQ